MNPPTVSALLEKTRPDGSRPVIVSGDRGSRVVTGQDIPVRPYEDRRITPNCLKRRTDSHGLPSRYCGQLSVLCNLRMRPVIGDDIARRYARATSAAGT